MVGRISCNLAQWVVAGLVTQIADFSGELFISKSTVQRDVKGEPEI